MSDLDLITKLEKLAPSFELTPKVKRDMNERLRRVKDNSIVWKTSTCTEQEGINVGPEKDRPNERVMFLMRKFKSFIDAFDLGNKFYH
jgi:hypothetical protein